MEYLAFNGQQIQILARILNCQSLSNIKNGLPFTFLPNTFTRKQLNVLRQLVESGMVDRVNVYPGWGYLVSEVGMKHPALQAGGSVYGSVQKHARIWLNDRIEKLSK